MDWDKRAEATIDDYLDYVGKWRSRGPVERVGDMLTDAPFMGIFGGSLLANAFMRRAPGLLRLLGLGTGVGATALMGAARHHLRPASFDEWAAEGDRSLPWVPSRDPDIVYPPGGNPDPGILQQQPRPWRVEI